MAVPQAWGHWKLTIVLALLFLLFASPILYKLVNTIIAKVTGKTTATDGCPKLSGLIIHALLFAIVTRAIVSKHRPDFT